MTDVEALQDQTAKLFAGSYAGNVDMLRAALERGADVNAVDASTGLSPLHYAIGRNAIEAVKLLLEHGAVVRPDKRGRWPSTIAELCEVDGALCDLIVDEEAKQGMV